MRMPRTLSLSLVSLLGTAWAVTLAVVGLRLVLDGPPREPLAMPGHAALAAGLTALAMGQFVFMVLVADRLFPDVGRRAWWAECVTLAAFVGGLLWLGWTYLIA